METKLQRQRDFEPCHRWLTEEHQYVHQLHLEGFKEDQIGIFMNKQGNLTISGRRLIDGKNVEGFSQRIDIPDDCEVDRIEAKLSNGILRLTMPKKTHWNMARNQAAARPATARRKYLKLGVGALAVALLAAAGAIEAYVAYKYHQCF